MAPITGEHVPDEIWRQVFQYFEGAIDDELWQMRGEQADASHSADLLSLCLVCSRFRYIGQFILYRTCLLKSKEREISFASFARTLRSSPQLGHNIRTLCISDVQDNYKGESFYASAKDLVEWPSELLALMEENVSTNGVFNVTAFHLSFMPNIQLLDITFWEPLMLCWILSGRRDLELKDGKLCRLKPNSKETGDVGEHVSGITRTLPTFELKNLTEVRLKYHAYDTLEATTIEPILLHPGIRTLRMTGLEWLGETASALQWREKPSCIRVLDLDECIIDPAGLQSMLQRFPELESLSIDIDDGGPDSRAQIPDLNLEEIGDVLREFANDLQELNLCFFNDVVSIEGELGSFQSLQSLRRLRVSLPEFIGDVNPDRTLKAMLPKTLETLYLNDESWSAFLERTSEITEVTFKEASELILDESFINLREIKMEDFNQDREPLKNYVNGWTSNIIQKLVYYRPDDVETQSDILVWTRANEGGDGRRTPQRGGWTRRH